MNRSYHNIESRPGPRTGIRTGWTYLGHCVRIVRSGGDWKATWGWSLFNQSQGLPEEGLFAYAATLEEMSRKLDDPELVIRQTKRVTL